MQCDGWMIMSECDGDDDAFASHPDADYQRIIIKFVINILHKYM